MNDKERKIADAYLEEIEKIVGSGDTLGTADSVISVYNKFLLAVKTRIEVENDEDDMVDFVDKFKRLSDTLTDRILTLEKEVHTIKFPLE